MSYYAPLQRPKYEYRRRLPHYQNASRRSVRHLSNFSNLILSDVARDHMMRHCLYDNGKRIHLSAAVVMPTHVHLAVLGPARPGRIARTLWSDILQALKSSSAHTLNKLLHRTGPF